MTDTGRDARAADFAARLAEAAKRKGERVERVETRTELQLPAELQGAIATLASQVLSMTQRLDELERRIGEFYAGINKAA